MDGVVKTIKAVCEMQVESASLLKEKARISKRYQIKKVNVSFTFFIWL